MSKPKVLQRFSFLLATVLLLTGCASTSAPIESASAATGKTARFYNQTVKWSNCGTNLTCASVMVPVNWYRPTKSTMKLAVVSYKATGSNPLGSILFNPGGPGASGYDYVHDSATVLGTAQLRSRYNLVGWDPRGVGRSAPVKCFDAKRTDELLYGDTGYPVGSAADVAASKKSFAKFVAACQRNTGYKMRYVDTVSTARDLDVLRAVVRDSKLNYLGYSYGTLIGATYAQLFPTKVGKLVLDGAIDPSVPDDQQSVTQLAGFDLALNNYLKKCIGSSDCPFKGTVEQALARIKSFMLNLETHPLQTSDGRELTVWGANTGMIMPLYSDSYWPYLSQAFTEAFGGDGTTFLELADAYNDRTADGKYISNLMEANIAIACLDSRSSTKYSDMIAQNKRLLAASPTLGRYWAFGALACGSWPYPVARHPKSYAAKGAAPIMVVGTTGDPATPYEQAVSLATKILSSGFLVTFNGEGHTAYGRSNSCIDNTVDDYFISGKIPAADPNC